MEKDLVDIASGCALLDADISTTLELSWALRTQTAGLWSNHTGATPDPTDLTEYDPTDVLLIVDNNVEALDGESATEILLSAADALATEIMNRLNRPWPELADRPGAVLEVNLVDGDVAWCIDGQPLAKLGDLGNHALK